MISNTGCDREMTAKEYYYHILPDKEFASHIPTDDELIRISNRYLCKGKSLDEMKDISKNATPDKLLIPLLTDVIKNMPLEYEIDSDDIFAGVYPLKESNAKVIRTPNSGYLILVNYGLKKCLWEWAKLVVNVVMLQLEHPDFPPDDSLKTITSDFTESIRNYNISKSIPAFPDYTKDEKSILVNLLHASALEFIIAHELAHITFGDVKNLNIESSSSKMESTGISLQSGDEYLKEIEVDKRGAEIFLNNSSSQKFFELDDDMKIAGIFYSLVIFEILEQLEFEKSQSLENAFPQAYLRLGSMKLYIEKNYDLRNYPVAIDYLNALNFLLNEAIITKPNIEELEKDDILLLDFYKAYKVNDTNTTYNLVDKNPVVFSKHAENLILGSELLAKGNFESITTDWSDGDFINAYKMLDIVVNINNGYKKKSNKNIIENIEEQSGNIYEALRRSAETFGIDLPSAKINKLQQAKIIELLIQIEFPDEFLFQKGLIEFEKKNYENAMNEWKILSEKNHGRAQYRIGHIYLYGLGYNQDYQTTAIWMNKAVANGSTDALIDLGIMHLSGQGVPINYKKAESLLLSASKYDKVKAYHNLGVLYNFVEPYKDQNKAIEYFEKAAEKGYYDSVYNIALITLSNAKTKNDYIKSLMWICIAKHFENLSSNKDDSTDLDYCTETTYQNLSGSEISLAENNAENWLIEHGFK